ncbi:transcription antitermination protein NusB [Brumimicrobium aurantiacum]|uniref:Transcription antitermination protein NusB n=1 Tax=Brumimicrobium aurantiacum TaxID=1737063 RepID=A0A3E1EYC6_9FLAO|nr:transcription antitermination protein NusB [Brumimicrobium aurantiacum]RFC54548.1 transcription antitermination protein NusB [Brumimicrobium aurantiacum]
MLNRRHLRIKVLQTLYAFSQHEDKEFLWAKKELLKAVDQMYELYISLLMIFPELKLKGEHRVEENKKKMLPKDEDINPNMKFIDNKIIQFLEENAELRHQSEDLKANWIGDDRQELMRKMYINICQSEVYFEYMNNGNEGFEEDKQFLVQLFKYEIANFPHLFDFLEEKSVYWVDDIDLACSMVIKTIKSFKEDSDDNAILPLYKPNDDEEDFITDLLRQAIKTRPENLELIDSLTQNWELDRIAKMDVLLMELAITELKTFSNIPTKVTLNEYIEISKFYSTPKSNLFINGVLDKAISKLESQGEIKKMGRGLMK